MSRAASHRFEPHRGEVRVLLRAPSLAALFEEAARALAEVMGGAPEVAGEVGRVSPRRVSLQAPDREALLVAWLNELIFLAETGRQIFEDVRVVAIADDALTAEVRGRPDERARTLVKAATFHGLSIHQEGGLLAATVLLDV